MKEKMKMATKKAPARTAPKSKKSAVSELKESAKSPVAAPVVVPPAETKQVEAPEAARLKEYNQLMSMKRLEMATIFEQMMAAYEQVSQVRGARAKFITDLAAKYEVDTNRQWAIDPGDLSIIYTDGNA